MEMIRLRDAVQALRGEIMQAAEAASIQSVRFELGSIEMEFQVVVKREGGGEAKLGFHIFAADATVGASGKIADERTQKVKIVLNPVLVDVKGGRSKLDISRDNDPALGTTQEGRGKQTLDRP
jgi:Trypsin-co-occurring domain 2